MKISDYMSSAALIEWLKVGIFAGELDRMATETKKTAKAAVEKEWAKKFRMCATLLEKVTGERLTYLDRKQLLAVERRKDHTEMRMYTSDQIRTDKNDGEPFEPITVAYEDMVELAGLALNSCHVCPQGACVAGCKNRELFHKIGVPVGRESTWEGECEFRTDDKMIVVVPAGGIKDAIKVRAEVKKNLKESIVPYSAYERAVDDERQML